MPTFPLPQTVVNQHRQRRQPLVTIIPLPSDDFHFTWPPVSRPSPPAHKNEGSSSNSTLTTVLHPVTRLWLLTIHRHLRFWLAVKFQAIIFVFVRGPSRNGHLKTPRVELRQIQPVALLFRWTLDTSRKPTSFCHHFASILGSQPDPYCIHAHRSQTLAAELKITLTTNNDAHSAPVRIRDSVQVQNVP